MAKCKNCTERSENINLEVREEKKTKVFYFPIENVRIEAENYEEAVKILYSKNN